MDVLTFLASYLAVSVVVSVAAGQYIYYRRTLGMTPEQKIQLQADEDAEQMQYLREQAASRLCA